MSRKIRILPGDCVEIMQRLHGDSLDAIVTDPPYGLEFMGKDWDKLGDPEWMEGATVTASVGLGERATSWVNYGSEAANPTCRSCGGRKRGRRVCHCETPDWHVRGESYDEAARRHAKGLAQQAWHFRWAEQALRVLKPGGYLLAFGGARTSHRLMCALEDAGFEIRDVQTEFFDAGERLHELLSLIDPGIAEAILDLLTGGQLQWLYGQGFNKAGYLSYQLERTLCHKVAGQTVYVNDGESMRTGPPFRHPDADALWPQGTALKPAFEPIIVARKPVSERTIAANVLKHGTGGLNIDGCRIAAAPNDAPSNHARGAESASSKGAYGDSTAQETHQTAGQALGRWPANVLLTHSEGCAARKCVPGCPVRLLDEQSGPRPVSGAAKTRKRATGGKGTGTVQFGIEEGNGNLPNDSGGASRFFYQAKANNNERWGYCHTCGVAFCRGDKQASSAHKKPHKVEWHPTVKPVELCRWLLRLVVPPGGTVADPFAGTGTVGEAAILEGFNAILIENNPIYDLIIQARIKAVLSGDRR